MFPQTFLPFHFPKGFMVSFSTEAATLAGIGPCFGGRIASVTAVDKDVGDLLEVVDGVILLP